MLFYKVLFIISVAFGLLFAQESVSEINRNIKTVNAEAEREKNLTEAEAKRHKAFLENSKQKTASLELQEKELASQIDSLKTEIEKLKGARTRSLNTARYFENRKVKYSEELAKTIDSLALFMESTFPYKNKESIEALKEISAGLTKGIISSEAAFGRAWEVMLEKVRIGYTAETWNSNLEFDSKVMQGKFFRYGTVASIFISQNGESVLWLNTETGKWQSVSEDFSLRTALRETMKVAEGKTAPKFSVIPVTQ